MRKNKIKKIAFASAMCFIGAASISSANSSKNGWAKESGKWYYYVNGSKACDTWALSGSTWYYLDEDGEMATNCFVNSDRRYTADEPDDTSSDWYYVGANGQMTTGWLEVSYKQNSPSDKRENDWYYFGNNGVMYSSAWIRGVQSWYYVLEDGKMLTDVIGAELRDDNEYRYEQDNMFDYIYTKSGALHTGWYQDSETKDWYYCDADGVMYENRWAYINGKYYYIGEGGITYTNTTGTSYGKYGIAEVDGKKYCFNADGAMQTGWIDVDDNKKSEIWHYFGSDGVMYENRWVRLNGVWYYLGADGVTYTNTTGTSYGKYGITNVNGYEYCFNASGAMQTGWIDVDDDKKVEKWHYFESDGVHVVNQWKKINKKWYFFGNTGEIAIGYLKQTKLEDGTYSYATVAAPEAYVPGVTYYYLNGNKNKEGEMLTGTVNLYEADGKTLKAEYYFKASGEMAAGEVCYVNRAYCYYGNDGAKVTNLQNTTIWQDSTGKCYAADTAKVETDKAYATVDANGVIKLK